MATAEMDRPEVSQRPARPDLTTEQKESVLAAAGEFVRSAVTGRPVAIVDPTLAGAADKLLSGAFVSLKRGKQLRSCCGGLIDQHIPLGRAVRDAAVQTALDDARFPPVSCTELAHLHMEVWLLFGPEMIQARGEDRVQAVTVGGKHGLALTRGQNRGLLLPGVAVDNNWDARRFLEQVCVKAGLQPTLWKDDATSIMTFEGEALTGRIGCDGDGNGSVRPTAPLRQDDLGHYLDFCRNNIVAFLTGALPQYYLFNVSDATVSGVALSIRRPGFPDSFDLSRFAFRPGVPLQNTLFSLTQAAAQAMSAQNITAADVGSLTFSLTVLHDPAMHGTVADPDLAGIETQHRAMVVIERGKAGIVFDPNKSVAELLEEGKRQAQVSVPGASAVFSMEAVASEPGISISMAPRPEPGPENRPAAMAGKFYPATAAELTRLVDDFLSGSVEAKTWPAAMVPHAGLVYSGRVAGSVLKHIRIPGTVIVLGPKHTNLGMEWSVAPHKAWSMPGFTLASDPRLARKLSEAIPGLALDAVAHQYEHAVEVELPFIARLAPETRVVGIALGYGDLPSCQRFAEGLASVLRQCDEPPLLLVSSDMNHYASDADTRALDDIALSALENLDPEEVFDTVTRNNISMCGVVPAVIVLETLRQLGRLHKAERVAYATTADTTGDKRQVVGYAGMLFG